MGNNHSSIKEVNISLLAHETIIIYLEPEKKYLTFTKDRNKIC